MTYRITTAWNEVETNPFWCLPFSHLRMTAKLKSAVEELSKLDEILIDQHGQGVLDGFDYKLLDILDGSLGQ